MIRDWEGDEEAESYKKEHGASKKSRRYKSEGSGSTVDIIREWEGSEE